MANVYETTDETEIVKKDGLGNGLVILTTIALILAVVLVQQAMKKHFSTGFFGTSKVPVFVAPEPGAAPVTPAK